MAEQLSYCQYVSTLDHDDLQRIYHDTAYGFPIADDNELFERLILEINQAGLSWLTILKKQKDFKRAYDNFEITRVAAYDESDVKRLLADPGIIRNKLKIAAAIYNAGVIVELQKEYGSFKQWLDQHRGNDLTEWTQLFKKTFKFTGGEIVNEFLVSCTYLPGAHEADCPTRVKTNTVL